MERVKIGISMGDPAGIGPEIIVKALALPKVRELCVPLVVGDVSVIERAVKLTGSGMKAVELTGIDEMERIDRDGVIPVWGLPRGKAEDYPVGVVSEKSGEAAFSSVVKLIGLATEGSIDATVTAPINKEAMNLAGHHFAGHTEIYAEYTGTKSYAMMLASGSLRVIHNSTHVSLREACDLAKKERLLTTIRLADTALKDMGIKNPRIAVSGLNPHAGENGLFGKEEIEEMIPAIKQAKDEGINASGPYPPDSIFARAAGGAFDIVVAMYHDQGHIPIKTAGFVLNRETGLMESVSGVNITLGLPIIRVSVDHGTAFDIAWKNVADEMSMVDSIEYAAAFARKRRGI